MLFFILFFPTLIAATCTAPDGTPTTGLCVECFLQGTKLPNGSCTYIPPGTFVVTSICTENTIYEAWCERDPGICVLSTPGIPCRECNGNGWLTPAGEGAVQCNCFVPEFNPLQGCAGSEAVNTTLIRVTNNTYCEPHRSHVLGCFKLDKALGVYGAPNPAVPSVCCEPFYGPPPAQIVANSFETCNSFGGPDPNDPNGFLYCSGHGDWNVMGYYCNCRQGWQAGLVGVDVYGNDAYTCNRCAESWGRRGDDRCGAPYFPALDGVDAPCSGRGDYNGVDCVCYQNETIGYWDLTEITRLTTERLGSGDLLHYNRTYETCFTCAPGWFGESCLDSSVNCATCPRIYGYTPVNGTQMNVTVGAYCDDEFASAAETCRVVNCTHYAINETTWSFFSGSTLTNSPAAVSWVQC